MGKKDRNDRNDKNGLHDAFGNSLGLVPIGFTSTMPTGVLAPQAGAGPLVSAVPPLSTVPVPMSESTSAGLPLGDPAVVQDTQRRLVELAVEKETLAVRLEDATRQREALAAKVAELDTALSELRAASSGSQEYLATLVAERDKLLATNEQLQDEILRLPEELETVTKSRAFRIMKAAPILAIRKPLSTLLIVGAMGALANLWDFSNIARTIYLVVGGLVLLVSAIQFLARND